MSFRSLHASTGLHQLPQAVKYPQSSQLQHPSHHSKSRSSKPAEKASLATDPFVLVPSLHSPPLPMTDNNIRILLSSDNHLGYNDKDPIRCNVCFAAFEEILMLARSTRCDLVLLSGDLFHENKPSRRTLYRTMEILRRFSLGSRPVKFRVSNDVRADLSDLGLTSQAGTQNSKSKKGSKKCFSTWSSKAAPPTTIRFQLLSQQLMLSSTTISTSTSPNSTLPSPKITLYPVWQQPPIPETNSISWPKHPRSSSKARNYHCCCRWIF